MKRMPYITLNNKPSISFKINKDNKSYVFLLEVGLNCYLDKIDNASGSGVLLVTCVSKDKPHHVHSNRLIGENCRSGVGVYYIKNLEQNISLKNLKIELTAENERKGQIEELKKNNVDPFMAGYDFDLESIDFNNFCLCFQLFIKDKNNKILRDKHHILYPVLSEQIKIEGNKENMLKLNTRKVGVAQQDIFSSDEDENVSEDSSDQETDDKSDSDDVNEETVEYNVTASRSSEFVQSLEQFVVSEDRKRCECNTKCKTKRCPCVNDNKQNGERMKNILEDTEGEQELHAFIDTDFTDDEDNDRVKETDTIQDSDRFRRRKKKA
ncbi:unnamed protein product [Brachionus calyciflorus]|uniref:RHD domain-containing protein n=1 Tax=Brachionus calyciflorus TaxID=104777 RepID=A0A814DNM7_9BILA|nr:unnamed protein product [Brachionus calyciflorus]